jgi:hypothetical protein
VEEVGEHADAALLDLRRLRVLGVVDEVAMEVPLRITCCASGSIHVVTNVARLRMGMPSSTSSSPISRIASTDRIPMLRQGVVGRRLEQEPIAVPGSDLVEVVDQRRPVGAVGRCRRCVAVLTERHGHSSRWRRTHRIGDARPRRIIRSG